MCDCLVEVYVKNVFVIFGVEVVGFGFVGVLIKVVGVLLVLLVDVVLLVVLVVILCGICV